MKLHTDIDFIQAIERPIVTIGTFDGVHLGHKVIIDRLNELATQEKGQSVLLTFHPHPRTVVGQAGSIDLLTTMSEKLALLEDAGLQHVIVQPFTHAFSRMTALEYVRDLLVNKIGVHTAVVGYDHHFGRHREGDIETFKELAEVYQFQVEEISAQMIDEVNVSSTKVRNALKAGEVNRVRTYLGYDYCVSGTVVHGEGRGKELGFPTANVLPDDADKLIPGKGVYAVDVVLKEAVLPGMLNIGTRPTFTDSNEVSVTLEVHIIGHELDLYGEQIQLVFKHRIREERKFDSADELKAQLTQDRLRSMELLGA